MTNMGTIKIEFDCPDFSKELNINIVIRKDGEVAGTVMVPASNLPLDTTKKAALEIPKENEEDTTAQLTTNSTKKKSATKSTTLSGNLMGMSF